MTQPDITIPVQQCARCCNDLSQDHKEAVKCMCRYLLKTRMQGITLSTDKAKGLELYVDKDWVALWKTQSLENILSSQLQTGYVIIYVS